MNNLIISNNNFELYATGAYVRRKLYYTSIPRPYILSAQIQNCISENVINAPVLITTSHHIAKLKIIKHVKFKKNKQ